MDVSIIYINYNACDLLLSSIQSLFQHTKGLDFEIIIVDNASEESTEPIKRICNDQIHLLQASENLGFGKANNLGLTIAKGRNILFLNPDTLLLNNAIKILSDTLDNNPKIGACGGNLVNKDLTATHSFSRIFPSILREADSSLFNLYTKIRYGQNAEFNHTGKNLEVAYICGADLMTRRKVLDKVGTFDPDFFLYYEETELEHRMAIAGYKMVSVPEAEIIHLEGTSFKLNEVREQHIFNGREVFFTKVYSPCYKRIADNLNILFLSLAIFISSLLEKKESKDKYLFRKSLYTQKSKK
ncbi:MAG: glycosyltransferase family 2 protein [Paludibacteraceae bacterium]|nr:glycosyltransferase family 2 protein [Paludibacteraceae bacterium]